jgi:hypothetical protein
MSPFSLARLGATQAGPIQAGGRDKDTAGCKS